MSTPSQEDADSRTIKDLEDKKDELFFLKCKVLYGMHDNDFHKQITLIDEKRAAYYSQRFRYTEEHKANPNWKMPLNETSDGQKVDIAYGLLVRLDSVRNANRSKTSFKDERKTVFEVDQDS